MKNRIINHSKVVIRMWTISLLIILQIWLYLQFVTVSSASLRSKCGYDSCPKPKPDYINVHMVPHTHNDVGWLKTVDQYFYGSQNQIRNIAVQYILDSVVTELERDKRRKFVYVETAFFWMWWKRQEESLKNRVRKLVNEGRLEFIGGGWAMHDEGVTHYQSLIDQMSWGFRQLDDAFGECARPRVGWQIDPFGHSRESASLMARFGFDGLFFARLDVQEKEQRLANKTAEMIWEGSPNLGTVADLFTSVLYHHYSAPDGFCFDIQCNDEPIIDDKDSSSYNADIKTLRTDGIAHLASKTDVIYATTIHKPLGVRKLSVQEFLKIAKRTLRATIFITQMEEQALYYKSQNILVTMGEDFNFQEGNRNFINIQRLIDAVNKNQDNDSNVNLFYSTPSCYLKAVNDEQLTFPTKTEDFFPYHSDDNTYWTGYFTSRPALKYYERIGNNFLQICKQLYSMANLDQTELPKLNSLREAMAILQHHDAVTGTERQAVAFDYARQLHKGLADCGNLTSSALSQLMTKPVTLPFDITLQSCFLLNISSCDITETQNTFVITLYNPLSRQVSHYVRIPIQGDGLNYIVKNASGNQLTGQTVPIPEQVQNVPGRESTATVELVFLANNIPPLGFKSYYVTIASNEGQSRRGKNVASIATKGDKMTMLPNDVNITQDFLWYKSYDGRYVTRSSGAYIFRPDGEPNLINPTPDSTSYSGPVVDEIHQVFNDWVSQVIRIYKHSKIVEYHWMIGPIPTDDEIGKEVITRYNVANIASNATFFTDSNGREMIKRVRDKRPDYDIVIDEPVAGNYYPITTRIMMKDSQRQVSIITDRAQGGSSMNDSKIEIMLHRRCVQDDNEGVGEVLSEEAFQTGLVVRGTHYVTSGKPSTQSAVDRLLIQQKVLSAWTFFTPTTMSFDQWKDAYNMEYSGLKKSLPPSVQILTLEPWKDNSFLIRLEHIMEKKDDPTKSKPVTVDLKNIFLPFQIKSIKETTLGGNQRLKDLKRLIWIKDSGGKTIQSGGDENNNTTSSIKLKAMQIRSFIVNLDFEKL